MRREMGAEPIRLGFAVRAIGGQVGGGGRGRHLSLTLAALGDAIVYLRRIEARFYRFAVDLPPGEGFGQLAECAPQMDALAEQVAQAGLRLGVHLPLGMALGGPDDGRAAAGLATVEATAALLERLDGGGGASTMVTHLGAAAGDVGAGERFAARFLALSGRARARLAVEHEGAGPSLGALLALHERCGVPVVLDTLHLELHNPDGLGLSMALGLALATWPRGARAEVHLSSHRSEAHLLPGRAGGPPRVLPPRPGQHADFVAAGDLERLLLAARGLPPFDVMLEAKAGDLALLRLRDEIARRAPGLATRLS
jgi:UV DNA damage endonuclease